VTAEVDTAVRDAAALRRLAARIRLSAVRMVSIEGFGYLGQALSSAEIYAALFGSGFIREGRDRFVLSPGHYAIGLYAVAGELGLLDPAELARYGADGALLEAISTERTPLADLTCGSLGQGLSGAIGLALADRLAGRDGRTIALLSDGELEEGQVWEAAMFAGHQRLERLVVLLDANGSQVDGPIVSVTTIEPIAEKWRAFGWSVHEIDGHDVEAVTAALEGVSASERPSVIVARTSIFGRLECFPAETDGHFVKLTDELRAAIVAELESSL
jgi:transketolase